MPSCSPLSKKVLDRDPYSTSGRVDAQVFMVKRTSWHRPLVWRPLQGPGEAVETRWVVVCGPGDVPGRGVFEGRFKVGCATEVYFPA